jgi:hypothetical protein
MQVRCNQLQLSCSNRHHLNPTKIQLQYGPSEDDDKCLDKEGPEHQLRHEIRLGKTTLLPFS